MFYYPYDSTKKTIVFTPLLLNSLKLLRMTLKTKNHNDNEKKTITHSHTPHPIGMGICPT